MNTHLAFSQKVNRDAKARELKSQGIIARKGSIRNQCLHPMYLEDEKANLSAQDCGFGNTIYKTYFSAIYTLDY